MKEKGIVKFFNGVKGFGFITDSKGKDYFVHSSTLNGSILSEGTKVEFESRQGQKGPEAINVTVIS
jgi:CspA family cold shock protein